MRGLMMDFPLSIPAMVRRAETLFGDRIVVSRRSDRTVVRATYARVIERARRLGAALQGLGVQPGDRVATLACSSQQHLEAYLAIPSIGAVLHTLNLRLHHADLAYIVNDARDRILIVDEGLLPLLEQFESEAGFEQVIVIGSPPRDRYLDYEALLEGADLSRRNDADLDEGDAAALCYTSGTTGRPKGVLYSHRAIVLHSFGQGLVDTLGIGERDIVLPVVPMFHVNAWGLPFTCTLLGAGQVFAGSHVDPKSIIELIVSERVTVTAGVPTVWLGLLQELDAHPGEYDLSRLRAIVVGGSAAPVSLIRGFKERHQLDVVHAWGMTEMTPVGTMCNVPASLRDAPPESRYRYQARQGTPLPFVEIRARTEQGIAPWDGRTMGELEVRGPWVARQYYNVDGPDCRFTDDGWFKTGDIVTIDARGCVELTDRAKDLVKSGGEWISSVALENALMGHPHVREAAVVAVPHPKWGERPLAVVVLKPGCSATQEELLTFLEPDFASWWLPDTIEFTAGIPKTSAGKFKKSALRATYRERYRG